MNQPSIASTNPLRLDDPRKFAVHGLGVELQCDVPLLDDAIGQGFWPFQADEFPERFPVTTGILRPYEQTEVMRHLSPTAVPLATPGQLMELYQEGERFWLVDDRWGLCELNLLRSTWRSWILPHPTLDTVRLFEMAVLWPLAQLLRPKGLWLVPAVSVVRADWGVLILSPINVEAELRALVGAGYSIIGQRWTAIREDNGRIDLLEMPGQVEREASPRLRERTAGPVSRYVDLTAEYCGIVQPHAFAQHVLIVEPARRPGAHVTEVAAQRAADLMRRSWPITELHPFRKHGQLPLRLSQLCRCWQIQLSRTPADLLVLLDSIRNPAAPGAAPGADPAAGAITLASASLSAPPPPPMRLAM